MKVSRLLFSIILFYSIAFLVPKKALAAAVSCGGWSTVPVTCLQSTGTGQPAPCTAQSQTCPNGSTVYFCGPPIPAGMCPPSNGGGTGVTPGTFNNLNNAIFGNGGPAPELRTPRGIISRLIPYLFTFGGLILFVMLIWGGFEMLTGAANPKNQEAGKQRIIAALTGFLLLFASYWLAQLVERIFGISIL